jgi:cyanophycinase-like exopeptidase
MTLTLRLATEVTTLALIGGGEFSFGETRSIDRILLERMPRDRRTVAFLPTASGSAEYAVHLGRYLHELDPSVNVVNVPIYRPRDARRQKNLNMILAAGMIYLGGGVAGTLLTTLRQSPAEMALRDAASNGALIAAIGAAAASFGTWVTDRGGGAAEGLGWLAETALEAGFDAAADTPLRRLMSLPDVHTGVGLPPKTALLVSADGTAAVEGDGQIAVFRKAP